MSTPKTTTSRGLNAAQTTRVIQALSSLTTDLLERRRMGSVLGRQFDGERLLYETLGYKKQPTFTDYEAYYRRNEIAKGVIKAPVDASWETFPIIEESDEKDTKFEQQAADIISRLTLQQVFSRLDTMASIGNYAVLLLGFKDGATSLAEPVARVSDLAFVMPYSQGAAEVKTFETDTQNPRFGLPTMYEIKIGTATNNISRSVHYSRVIHVAQECLTNPIEGTPQLEVIFNRLFDIEKVVGADAEAFWRMADPGIVFNRDKDYGADAPALEKYEEKILDFIHRLKRHLLIDGATATPLQQQIADPLNHFNTLMDMVAAGKRIPKRVLLGSELGELASTMDLVRWYRIIKARREQFCEPEIIRPFFDRLIEVGVLKRDQNTPYNVKWDDLLTPSDKEKAEVGQLLATALANYINSGGDTLVSPEVFLGWLGRPKEEIERIAKEMATRIDDDLDETPADDRTPDELNREPEPVEQGAQ